jgi:hypothetical protein
MDIKLKRFLIGLFAVLFATLGVASASAYHYGSYGSYGGYDRGMSYYPSYGGYGNNYYGGYGGYYSYPQIYGWSGWGYSRVYYNYHYPYSQPNNFYPYAYRTYPAYAAYPFPGQYW